MQVRGLRRQFGGAWQMLSRLAPVAIAVEVAMLLAGSAEVDGVAAPLEQPPARRAAP